MQQPSEERLAGFVNGIGRAACWLFLPLMVIIVFDVVGRRFLALPTVRLQELQWYLHGIMLLLTLGYAYLAEAHVRIDVLAQRLSERARILIEIAGICLFLVPYLGLLLYLSVGFAWQAYQSGEASSAAQGFGDRWIIKAFLPLGFGVTLLAGVVVLRRSLRRLASERANAERESRS